MKNPIKLLNANINYLRFKHQADKLHAEGAGRVYVLGTENGYVVVGNKSFIRIQNYQMRKAKGTVKTERNITVSQMELHSFYTTPYKDESKPLASYELKGRKQMFIQYALTHKIKNK